MDQLKENLHFWYYVPIFEYDISTIFRSILMSVSKLVWFSSLRSVTFKTYIYSSVVYIFVSIMYDLLKIHYQTLWLFHIHKMDFG